MRTHTAAVAAFFTATVAACFPEAEIQPFVSLEPVASSEAPLSENGDIALVSEDVACVINSFEFQIQCGGRAGRVVGAFGGEGDGPGEFRRPAIVERGTDGTLGVVDLGLTRLTLFQPSGILLSETQMPPGFAGHALAGGLLFGTSFATSFTPERRGRRFSPGVAEVDVISGEVLWTRSGIDEFVETGCGTVGLGWPNPGGGYVFWACDRELIFLNHKDAVTATVVASPTYFEEFPNERDVDAYLSDIARLTGRSPPVSEMERYAESHREKPKQWILGSTSALGFDSQGRLWVATTRDRDAFSYLDIWMGTEYAGTVRIRDRLMGYDLFGATLVALVERAPGRDGVAQRAIDWYSIDGLDFGS